MIQHNHMHQDKILNRFCYLQSCLSGNPSKPCFILHFKGVTLMLDCGLDISQVLKFLPLSVVPK